MSQVCFTIPRRIVLFAVAALAALLPAAQASQAVAQESLGPEYLSSKACAVLVVRAGDIHSAPETELWPWEIIQAIALRDLQIDSEHIAEIMLQVETPAPSRGGPPNPEMAAVIRLTQAYDIDDVLPMFQRGLEEGEINGSPARFSPQHGQPSLYMPDEKTLVLGGGPMLRRIGQLEDSGTKLSEMYTALSGEDNATLVVDLEALRPLLQQMREGVPAEGLPPPLVGLLDAPEMLDGLILTANITGDFQCRMTLQATDETVAEEMSQRLSAALEFAANMSINQARTSMPDDDAISQAWVAYAERRVPEIFESLNPEVQGDQLVLEYTLGPVERLAIRFGMATAVAGFSQDRLMGSGGSGYDEEMMYEDYEEYGDFEGDFGEEDARDEAFDDEFEDAPFDDEFTEEDEFMEDEDAFEFNP